jgi:mono/diheme cytochrome c family protein
LSSRIILLALACAVCAAGSAAWAQGDARKGQYLAKAAGCAGCHTDNQAGAQPYAGGREIATPFGKFYGPNLTPHPQAGLGRWTLQDFRRAIRLGERRDGAHYYPAFPYPSFTGMTDADIADLWAYLRSLPPSSRQNRPHDLHFPFQWRFLVTFWKWLFFTAGPFASDPKAAQIVTRGAYLVGALAHCGECHTPRNFLGAPKKSRSLAGAKLPDGRSPNLTPTRLKRWDDRQLADFLRTGVTPAGDAASEVMEEVIQNTTSQLTAQDLAAIIAFLRALAPLPDEPK